MSHKAQTSRGSAIVGIINRFFKLQLGRVKVCRNKIKGATEEPKFLILPSSRTESTWSRTTTLGPETGSSSACFLPHPRPPIFEFQCMVHSVVKRPQIDINPPRRRLNNPDSTVPSEYELVFTIYPHSEVLTGGLWDHIGAKLQKDSRHFNAQNKRVMHYKSRRSCYLHYNSPSWSSIKRDVKENAWFRHFENTKKKRFGLPQTMNEEISQPEFYRD